MFEGLATRSYQATSPTDNVILGLKNVKDNLGRVVIAESTGLYADSLYYRIRHASFRAAKDSVAVASFSDDLSVLSVEGFCVASIDETLSHQASRKRSPDEETPKFDLADRVSLTTLVDKLVSKGCYETHGVAREGVCKTIIEGTRQSQLIEEEHIESWPSWVAQINAQNVAGELQPHRDAWNSIVKIQRNRDLLFAQPLIGDNFPDLMFGKCFDWVESGDLVCIFLGCDVPLILRTIDDYYELVGDCYIDGLMDGQAIEVLAGGGAGLMTFDLH